MRVWLILMGLLTGFFAYESYKYQDNILNILPVLVLSLLLFGLGFLRIIKKIRAR